MVAGEANDLEGFAVLLADAFVELFEPFVLGREATFGGCVYDENDFALVVCEGDFGTLLYNGIRILLQTISCYCAGGLNGMRVAG